MLERNLEIWGSLLLLLITMMEPAPLVVQGPLRRVVVVVARLLPGCNTAAGDVLARGCDITIRLG